MQENSDTQVIKSNWWVLVVRGIIAIIFGVIALLNPGIVLIAFIYVFAGYVILDGLAAITAAVQERGFFKRWGWILFEGILGAVIGSAALIYPYLTALALLYVIASWAVVTGIVQVVAAVITRGFAISEWALGLAGLISFVFGVLLFVNPGAGLRTLVWLLGIYGIVFGILFAIRAVQWRLHWRSLAAASN
jgi:uncharacterized membrane protein HdeD (DUF308 family)